MMRIKTLLVSAALGVVLAGCPDNKPIADAGCAGQVGCACEGGTTCSVGECVSGTCVDCQRGALACACRSNSTCNAGFRCTAAVCETCPAGEANCACTAQNTCNAGLTCSGAGTCTPSSCMPGQTGCACRAGGDAGTSCDGASYCDSMSTCRACSTDVVGCACGTGNTCTGGLTCAPATTTCQAALTCDDLRMMGTCKPHQQCTNTTGANATCVSGACDPNYKWDATSMTCLACVSAGCTNEPTCAVDGGIGGQCAANNQTCTQVGMVASCGACLPGFVSDGANGCVAAPTCNGVVCTSAQYCDVQGTPTCTTLPCPTGSAKPANGGACVMCGSSCMGVGLTGRVWPLLSSGGNCVCETLPGYFVPQGSSGLPRPCDADHDGWVNKVATTSTDPAYIANTRCTVRTVDTVRLVDEFGVGLELRSCLSGMVEDGGTCTVLPLPLYEAEITDVPGQPAMNAGTSMPPYGGDAGRELDARELNALTKACVDKAGDFNADTITDLGQTQPVRPIATTVAETRLSAFSFYLELYSGWYEPPSSRMYGTLVIAERSRCSPDFPVHYDPAAVTVSPSADQYQATLDGGANYWRSCERRRDPAFDPSKPNFDFAQWDCASQTPGTSCPSVPPAHATLTAPTDPATTLLRNFGLCELDGGRPADGVWRGMTAHSQFKCVKVVPTTPADPWDVPASDTSLVINRCRAKPCAGPSDPTCVVAQGTGAQTLRPVIECTPLPAGTAGVVGFAAVKYRHYGVNSDAGVAYRGGCINEETETATSVPTDGGTGYGTYVCPYPEYLNTYQKYELKRGAVESSFGRYSCFGDEPNFLWAESATVTQRATLWWTTGGPDAGSFWR